MNRLWCVILGIMVWSACANAEESTALSGRFFAPVGGLVALDQPPSEVVHFGRVALVPDSKVTYDIGVRLLDPSIAAPNVVISVKNQEVILTGTVHSGAQADEVERAARQVPGIVSLTNLVEVR